jgi:hypothetical protein
MLVATLPHEGVRQNRQGRGFRKTPRLPKGTGKAALLARFES